MTHLRNLSKVGLLFGRKCIESVRAIHDFQGLVQVERVHRPSEAAGRHRVARRIVGRADAQQSGWACGWEGRSAWRRRLLRARN